VRDDDERDDDERDDGGGGATRPRRATRPLGARGRAGYLASMTRADERDPRDPRAAESDLDAELRALEALPSRALAELWAVLGPSLADPIPAGVEEQLQAFVEAHALDPHAFARSLRAARLLLHAAARGDASVEELAHDLAARGVGEAAGQVLLSRYEEARAALRGLYLERMLADNGALLTDATYRIDMLMGGPQNLRMRTPVTLLSLGHRTGTTSGRLTVQLTTEGLRALRDMLDEALSQLGDG
jgi:hypothetical protein